VTPPGTISAVGAVVRASVFVLCAACAGPMRPAVIHKLSELPADPERRDAMLDSAHVQRGPERQPASPRARKVETAAATAAAWIGILFSKSANVTMGGAAPIDENLLVEPKRKRRAKAAEADDAESSEREAPPADLPEQPSSLVPWVRFE
jgi:hypothetical protein